MTLEVHTELDPHTRVRWIEFLKTSPHEYPGQYPEFAVLSKDDKSKLVYVLCSDENGVCCVGVFTLRMPIFGGAFYGEALSQGGPVFNTTAAFEQFLTQIAKHPLFARVGIIKIHPYWLGDERLSLVNVLHRSGWNPFSQYEMHQTTGLIDITRPADDILRSFSKSARYAVRQAQRLGVTVGHAKDVAEAEAVFRAARDLFHRRDLDRPGIGLVVEVNKYVSVYESVFSKKELGTILAARSSDGSFLAGLLLFTVGRTALVSLFVVANRELHKIGNLRIAPYLWWTAMVWAKQRNCSVFDVGGYKENLDPNDSKYPIFKYKGEFSPVLTHQLPWYHIVSNRFVHVWANHGRKIIRTGRRVVALLPSGWMPLEG
jgi:Acetyltransferase (GNAT) domain